MIKLPNPNPHYNFTPDVFVNLRWIIDGGVGGGYRTFSNNMRF